MTDLRRRAGEHLGMAGGQSRAGRLLPLVSLPAVVPTPTGEAWFVGHGNSLPNNVPLFGLICRGGNRPRGPTSQSALPSRCGNAQGLVAGERQGSLMNSSSINLELPLMTTITPTR
jgi:hypothetical protein